MPLPQNTWFCTDGIHSNNVNDYAFTCTVLKTIPDIDNMFFVQQEMGISTFFPCMRSPILSCDISVFHVYYIQHEVLQCLYPIYNEFPEQEIFSLEYI